MSDMASLSKLLDDLAGMMEHAKTELKELRPGELLHLSLSGWIMRLELGYHVDVWRGHEKGKTIDDYITMIQENQDFLELYAKTLTPKKVLILLTAYGQGATESEIGKAVALHGGALHYHLKDLLYLGLLEKTGRGMYRTTRYGTFVIRSALSAIRKFKRSIHDSE
jgi:predicted transcriptional regulator